MEKKGFQISGWLVFFELCLILLSGVCVGIIAHKLPVSENISSCIIQLFTFIPIGVGAIFLKKIYNEKTKDLLGLRGFDITMLLFFLVLPYFAQNFALIAAAPANYVLSELFGNPENVSIPQNVPDFLWLLLSVCILAPVTEELLFRGVIMKLLSPFGIVTAVVVSSVMFSLLHVSPAGIIVFFAMGVVLGIVRYVSGSVVACVAVHAISNFYSVIETVFYNQIEAMDNIYVIFALISAILFIPIILLYKKIYPQEEHYQKTQYVMGISIGFILTLFVFMISSVLMIFMR